MPGVGCLAAPRPLGLSKGQRRGEEGSEGEGIGSNEGVIRSLEWMETELGKLRSKRGREDNGVDVRARRE